MSYDAAGNLTQKQNTVDPTDKTSYTWDASNRLRQIAQTGAAAANALNASFTYDTFGRRIQSSISQGGNPAQTVQYLYEGQQALGEIRNGQLSHRLLTGLNLDETIARIAIASSGQKDAANSRVYMTDALNSVIAQLSDDNATAGSIQNSYGYSPYGEAVTVGPDATKNPVQYTSRENDGTAKELESDPDFIVTISVYLLPRQVFVNHRSPPAADKPRWTEPPARRSIVGIEIFKPC